MKKAYTPFDRFVFRSPLLSFENFIKYLSDISESEDNFKKLFHNKAIQEAIYIASPVLFEELIKYLNNGISDKKDKERFKYSVVRYLSRMSTRCTPFGVFAGCALGRFGENTDITLFPSQGYQRHTRLDMNYLCALAQDITRIPEIKHNVNYFRNSSIYKLGDKLRYVEYFYNGTRRIHRIAAVDYSEYLGRILEKVSDGATFKELAELLVDDEISLDDAWEFIDELIDAQLLVSELEPSVTGQEFLYQIFQKLQDLVNQPGTSEIIKDLFSRLQHVDKLLAEIDKQPIGETLEIYNQVISDVRELGTKFEHKYLFQTDMIKPVETAILNSKIVDDVLDALEFLNKITPPNRETLLSKFKETFYERYEEMEMPLLETLDNETGIGYKHTDPGGDINQLIDDLVFPQQSEYSNNINWNRIQSVMFKKYLKALTEKKYTIELTDDDFKGLTADWEDMPLTNSVFCEILQDNEKGRKIFLKVAGGSSAANLLGRFCHADEQIKDHVLQITETEEELSPEIILAEIAHLPESRTGNILLRPVLRPYEIPYLAKSAVAKEYQIELSDLMISVRKGKIVLRSKRLNKEIVPRLSNAHNFQYGAMPVYQFLCDMQMQNMRGAFKFDWGGFASEYRWLPRVKYKNVILSPAGWIGIQEEVKNFFEITNDQLLIESVTKWRQSLQMPKYVTLNEGDNGLFIDMENALSIRTLFSVIKKRPSFYLEEFLFNPENALVKGEEGIFTNEFIISFYKEKENGNLKLT